MSNRNQRAHKRAFAQVLAALTLIGASQDLHAQIQYWDINGTTAGAGGASPSGTWSASSTNFGSSDGTAATSTFVPGATPAFSAGADATGSSTITVTGSHSIGGMFVEEGNVVFAGGTFAISGASSFDIAPGASAT
jgi:hypothetical protein